MDTAHTHRQAIRLTRGQSRWLRSEPGTLLVGLHGTVAMTEAPRWLAGTVWNARVLIHAGQAHSVSTRGWVQLSADADAELLCVPACNAAPRTARAHLLWALLRFARRTFA